MLFNALLTTLLVAVPIMGNVAPRTYAIWAGGLFTEPAGTVRSVTSDILVPSLLTWNPDNGKPSGSYGLWAWIGIDGTASCFTNKGLLQAGIRVTDTNDIDYDCYAWAKWYPQPEIKLPIGCTPGDVIAINVTATSTTTGIVTVTNTGDGLGDSFEVTATTTLSSMYQGISYPLCLEYGDFMVESHAGSTANWGTVPFFGPKVILANGTTQADVAKATPCNMVVSSTTVAVAQVTSNDIYVNYVGP